MANSNRPSHESKAVCVTSSEAIESECRMKKRKPNPNVLPHGDDLMDVEYIGGIYDEKIRRSHWDIGSSQGPYLKYLKAISEEWPHIAWLADFMEVGTSPLKWRDLQQCHIDERAKRTNVAILEFSASGAPPLIKIIENSTELRRRLGETDLLQDPSYARFFIVEDLSRDVIEALGYKYDIDPLYFRSQISDYLWHNTSDPWVELHDLPHVASERNHFNMRYMRPRYFELEDSLKVAKGQLGEFNVLRRLDEDLSWHVRKMKKTFGATVGLVRSKAALWIRDKNIGQGVIGILVVDPTLQHGHPLWGGPRNLKSCPSVTTNPAKFTPRKTLFEDVCHYACTMPQEEIQAIGEQPLALALPIISLVAAEWMSVVSYIISGLTTIEWQLEHPHYRRHDPDLASLLDRLHPLRRQIPVYSMMLNEILNTILNPAKFAGNDHASVRLQKLNSDFKTILKSVEQLQTRTQHIISLVTTIIGVEENKRAVKANKSLVGVTYLAFVFAPMAFVSSFFSMSADVSQLKHTFWTYFAVAVPITALCFLIADQRILKIAFRERIQEIIVSAFKAIFGKLLKIFKGKDNGPEQEKASPKQEIDMSTLRQNGHETSPV